MYHETVEEMLKAWDEGETIWTVEMGGLGPGYEQAIQVLMVELCRGALGMHRRHPNESQEQYSNRFHAMREEVVHRINSQCGGFSGAQVGAATNLAYRFFTNGPAEAIKKFKEQQASDEDDRMIQVSSFWPKAEEPAKESCHE